MLDPRSVQPELLDGLIDSQMLGTPRHFVEPPIWEMGHVGWFQELWVLRHLDGAPSLLPGSDRIYDSFNVSYTRRWDHEYTSRKAPLDYISEVLQRWGGRLEGREPTAADTGGARCGDAEGGTGAGGRAASTRSSGSAVTTGAGTSRDSASSCLSSRGTRWCT